MYRYTLPRLERSLFCPPASPRPAPCSRYEQEANHDITGGDGSGDTLTDGGGSGGGGGGGGGGVSDGAAADRRRRQRSVVRALHLLEEFVDETEMGGTAGLGLTGHGARVRGAKVVLNFENKVRSCASGGRGGGGDGDELRGGVVAVGGRAGALGIGKGKGVAWFWFDTKQQQQ